MHTIVPAMSTTIPASASVTVHPLAKEAIAPKICVGLLHRGPYHEIGDTFKEFFAALNGKKEHRCGASTKGGKVLGLYLDNPQTTKPENLRSYAAMEITPDDLREWPETWEKVKVGGGLAAVMAVNGSYSQLGGTWQGFGKRVHDQGWKLSGKPEHISQELYISMDYKDESKSVTKLVMFLEE